MLIQQPIEEGLDLSSRKFNIICPAYVDFPMKREELKSNEEYTVLKLSRHFDIRL